MVLAVLLSLAERACQTVKALSVGTAILMVSVVSGELYAQENSKHFHYANVLGTSFDIDIDASNSKAIEPAIEQMLAQIKQLELVLSTWRNNSEISQLNTDKKAQSLSAELSEVLGLCQHWRNKSQQHFSCRMGALKKVWLQAVTNKAIPDRVQLRALASRLNKLSIDRQSEPMVIDDDLIFDLDGVAKGYILDKVMKELVSSLPSARTISLNLGGDILVWQSQKQRVKGALVKVDIADPRAPKDNQSAIELNLVSGAVAASGHDARGYQVDSYQFSHILSPKDGWPQDYAPAAVVVAKTATEADAIATALSAQSASAGIDWVNQLSGVEALIVSPNGFRLASSGWQNLLAVDAKQQPLTKSAVTRNAINLSYQIPALDVDKYERPYLAIWLTDKKQKPIRNLLLLGENERWAKKNSRWWRRVGRRNPELLDILARSTRRPGVYQLAWDGLDDFGQPVAEQPMILHVEAAREHGEHDYQKVELSLAQGQKTINLPIKGELGAVDITLSN